MIGISIAFQRIFNVVNLQEIEFNKVSQLLSNESLVVEDMAGDGTACRYLLS